MTGRKTVTTTHGRYTVDGSVSEKTIKLMAMPYEQTLTIHDAETGRLLAGEEETPQRGDTILITDYERILPRGEGHIAVVRLAELRGTTTVDECLYETSVVIGDRPFLRMVAESAIYCARERGIRRVVVANGDVWEVVEAGGIDTTGVEVVRDLSPPAAGDNILVTDFDRHYTMGDEFVAVVRDLSPPAAGDNILVTDFDRHYTMGDEFVAVVRVRERYGYTPTDGGYSETVVVQGDRAKLREAVRRALDYARDRGLRRVCINNRQVREDIEAGVIDTTDLEVVYGGGALR